MELRAFQRRRGRVLSAMESRRHSGIVRAAADGGHVTHPYCLNYVSTSVRERRKIVLRDRGLQHFECSSVAERAIIGYSQAGPTRFSPFRPFSEVDVDRGSLTAGWIWPIHVSCLQVEGIERESHGTPSACNKPLVLLRQLKLQAPTARSQALSWHPWQHEDHSCPLDAADFPDDGANGPPPARQRRLGRRGRAQPLEKAEKWEEKGRSSGSSAAVPDTPGCETCRSARRRVCGFRGGEGWGHQAVRRLPGDAALPVGGRRSMGDVRI